MAKKRTSKQNQKLTLKKETIMIILTIIASVATICTLMSL